jgi:glycosyltransferase 2 family protein
LRRNLVKAIASLVIAAGFVWLLRRGGFPLAPQKELFGRIRFEWLAVHVVLVVLLHFTRAMRWRHLLRPLDPDVENRRVLSASWVGFAAIIVLPLRTGELVRPYLIKNERRGLGISAALGTVGAERVIDGLMVTIILAGALAFVPRLDPLPTSIGDLKIPVAAIPAAASVALIVFAGAFVAMAIFYFARDVARSLVRATIGRISPRLGERLAAMLDGLASGLRFLTSARNGGAFIGETLVFLLINALSIWACGRAAGLPLTLGQALAVMGIIALGILVPAGPGVFGAFQAATYAALAMYFPLDEITTSGAVYVFLLYVVQIVWHLAAAGIAFAIDPEVLKRTDQIL